MRSRPSPLAAALERAVKRSAPRTPLAAVQSAWREAVGDAVAAEAEPVSERDGAVGVACRSATWAQELDLMQEDVRERLNAVLAREGAEVEVAALRFSADAARHTSK